MSHSPSEPAATQMVRKLQAIVGAPHSLSFALAADGVGIARKSGCTRLASPAVDGAPEWASGLVELDGWLAGHAFRAARARMAVSARYVRFCLIPWVDRRLSLEQERAWVRLQFETAYGDMQDWQATVDVGAYGQARFACALPADLIEQWNALCRRHRLAGGRLEPYFVRVWNRWRSRARPGQLWGVAESDRVVWGCIGRQGWSGLHCMRARTGTDALAELAARELRLLGDTSVDTLMLHLPVADGISAAEVAGMPTNWLESAGDAESCCQAMARLGETA